MRTKTLLLIGGLVVVGIVGYLVFTSGSGKNPPQVMSFAECVAAGYETTESDPRECRTPSGETFTEPGADIDDEPVAEHELIRVTTPKPNDEIASPFTVTGEARGRWFFEASFPVKLLDANGTEIQLDPPYIMTTEDWMSENFVPFEETFTFGPPMTETGTLVLMKDNPSGLPENDDEIRIPVRFGESYQGETMEVSAYFSNPTGAKEAQLDCSVVEPVKRRVPKTAAVAEAALTELLKGPTAAEHNAGYVSAIPRGVKMNSLSVTNGVAKVDFSKALEPGGGACAVTGIRAQIEKTLMQFSTVKSVTISVDGKTDDILQP